MKRLISSLTLLITLFISSITLASGQTFIPEGSYVKEALQSVVFIFDSSTDPCSPSPPGESYPSNGTGFVMGMTLKVPKSLPKGRTSVFKFLVTNHHVIGDRDSVVIRLNRIDKPEFACFPIKLIRTGKDKNVFTSRKAEVDLAVISIPDFPNTDPYVLNYSFILDESYMSELDLSEGTDIFSVGYLYGYSGNKRNFPVAKFGKIAMLTNEPWYRSQKPRNMNEEAYLVELQNVPGLSGAPVFLQSPQFQLDKTGKIQARRVTLMIVGVVKGLLPSPIGGSQGVAAIEPAYRLRELFKDIAILYKAAGAEVETNLQAPAMEK